MPDDILTSGDLISHSKGLSGKGGTKKRVKSVAVPYDEFVKGIGNEDLRADFEMAAKKAVGSENVSQYRLVSLVPEQDVLRNEETVFMNIAEANGPVISTDLTLKIRERHIGAGDAEFFNVQGALPAGRQSNYPSRTNSHGFAGNLLDIKWLAQELVGQSPVENADLKAQEVEDEIIVLRRFMNSKLLSNTEITSEVIGTQPGGFIDRSTANNIAVGPGADLTNPLIQGRVDAIANATSNEGLGYKIPLVALCHGGQLAKIRDLMIARYPGENSESFAISMRSLMQRLANVAIPEDTMAIYKPLPGRPIIFLQEEQLPAGHCVFFDPNRVQISKFRMMGQVGPWVLERPTSALTSLVLVWDAFSLVDRLVESRAIITGLND